MLLNQTVEYALRITAVLAAEGDGRLTAPALAERCHLPTPYASKVLRKLVVAGLVDSLKGHHGGFRLARPPQTVTLEEVLRAVDFDPQPTSCAFGFARCNPDRPCALHPAWAELKERVTGWARGTTLADAVRPVSASDAPPSAG